MYICDIRLRPPPLPVSTHRASLACLLSRLPATRPQLFSRLLSLLPSHMPGSLFQISNILTPTPFSFKVPRPSTLPVLAVPHPPPPRCSPSPEATGATLLLDFRSCPMSSRPPRPTPLPLLPVASQVSVLSQAPDLPESASHIPLPGRVPSQGGLLPKQGSVFTATPLSPGLSRGWTVNCAGRSRCPASELPAQFTVHPFDRSGTPSHARGPSALPGTDTAPGLGPRLRGLLSGAGPPPASRPIPPETPTRGSSRRGFRGAGLRGGRYLNWEQAPRAELWELLSALPASPRPRGRGRGLRA